MAGGEGIATNILAQRLHQLTLEGIIDKVQMASDRRKHLYRLTAKGIDLAPVLQAMMVWGARYERTAAPPSAIREMTSQPDLFLMKVRKQWEEERARLDRKDQMTRRTTKTKGAPMPESDLVIRVRKTLARRRGISENRMFGGACFYGHGNMIGGVSGKDELVVRVGPGKYEACLEERHARPMDFTGRPMRGYVYVDPPGYDSDAKLRAWLDKGLAYARSLPPKEDKK